MRKKVGTTERKSVFLYYVRSVWRSIILPRVIRRWKMQLCLHGWEKRADAEIIRRRVAYYNRLPAGSVPGSDARCLRKITLKNTHSRYWFDLMRYLRAFSPDKKISLINGDTWENPTEPTICKARRLDKKTDNCVLMNLDSLRHFTRVTDFIPFEEKADILFFRGEIHGKPHRIRFFEMWAGHPLTDLGDTAKNWESPWPATRVSIPDHFRYKYILALEGNDVATALQWICDSNCIPVMTRPTVESWLMHGAMQPGVHYIEIKSDFSDVAEKIAWYNSHPNEAKAISEASKEWMRQFQNSRRENIIAYLVAQRYFENTRQTE
ncbi:MAG: lipopolysaccharide biosynthesis protein [Bacteroidales bacterium]|nr:lipopolysaccharide biosynthesis protein [Bacteroidales bacterium]